MARGPRLSTIILRGLAAASRAEQQRQRAAMRARAAAEREALRRERRQVADIRARERELRADAREAARAHVASQIEEAEELSSAIAGREGDIASVLSRTLRRHPTEVMGGEPRVFRATDFDPRPWLPMQSQPRLEDYEPDAPTLFEQWIPFFANRRKARIDLATKRFEQACLRYAEQMEVFEQSRAQHEKQQAAEEAAIAEHNRRIELAKICPSADDRVIVVEFVEALLAANLGDEEDAIGAEVGYSSESRHFVIDLELPDLSVVPAEASFKYVKSADRIDPVLRPPVKRKALYAHLIAQIVLKCLDTIFRGTHEDVASCVTVNGMLDSVNLASGHQERNCLISVRVTREEFKAINLELVNPERCLSALKASISRSPADLVPVKPLVELDMVDPRFVDTTRVMSGMDNRTNLMELTPSGFEGLIAELFARMGLETRQTQASRDGGVDCVAFDPRPVFGGKVVIQAKRYRNTVGVSAVRDLFGTMQNEGATKGILVTTSGYGQAAFDFAKGKPLELLDGGNLLFLLNEHAGIDARIVMPEDWTEDSPGDR